MRTCKIQKPTGNSKNNHGKIIVQITCNDAESEEIKFDATNGDLHLNLICEEEEGFAFYIGSDFKEAIEKMNKKIEKIEEDINELKLKIKL
jgi:phage-related protein